MDNYKLQAFLGELYALSLKYDLWIGGCGCCSSPFLSETREDDVPTHYRVHPNGDDLQATHKHRATFVVGEEWVNGFD